MRKILLHKIKDVRRNYRRQRRAAARDLPLDDGLAVAQSLANRSSGDGSPGQELMNVESARQVALALATLSANTNKLFDSEVGNCFRSRRSDGAWDARGEHRAHCGCAL